MSDIKWPRRNRWTAAITYRTDAGSITDEVDLSELRDLHEHVEAGPHFDTIISIGITRGETLAPGLTVEQSQGLTITDDELDALLEYIET